ncbi:divalent metal cation transporter [Dyella sp. KRB-257]|uniref:divalent metal cation transporter n=1 Tax=Dyella sp. KRB-257 TaxID=3400915 RepID=UPI003C017447
MDVRRSSAPLRALASRTTPWRAKVGGATAKNLGARTWGAGTLVAVGYMDPGNWATDVQAGAQFGYGLVPVVVLASLAAMLLQSISAALVAVTGQDLACLCRVRLPRAAVVSM